MQGSDFQCFLSLCRRDLYLGLIGDIGRGQKREAQPLLHGTDQGPQRGTSSENGMPYYRQSAPKGRIQNCPEGRRYSKTREMLFGMILVTPPSSPALILSSSSNQVKCARSVEFFSWNVADGPIKNRARQTCSTSPHPTFVFSNHRTRVDSHAVVSILDSLTPVSWETVRKPVVSLALDSRQTSDYTSNAKASQQDTI